MNSFSSLIGQNQAVELLTQAVAKNRIAPAYLFAGSPGVGRGLAARCFLELLLSGGRDRSDFSQSKGGNSDKIAALQKRIQQGNHPDLLWVEPTYLHQGKRLSAKEAEEAGLKRKAPPQIRLEQIRELGEFLSRPPLEALRLVVVLEQAETMAEAAANGLLKTLEEPGRATIILIAPTVESLLPTLVSRCQRIPFYCLDGEGMGEVLRRTGNEEILSHPEVMAMAQGSPGQAIAAWEQLQTIPHDLLEKLKRRPQSVREALTLAREIDKTLESEAQLWLLDYLQHCYWQQFLAGGIRVSPLQQLEKARQHLLSYVGSRLVWECTLMGILMASGA